MTSHGTATNYALGQFAEVQATITRALPKALMGTDPKEVIRALQNGEQLERMLAEGLRSLQGGTLGGGKVISSFAIRCEGLKVSELVRRGGYDMVNDLITDESFPLEAHEPVTREIEFVEFDHEWTSREGLNELRRLGLERPTPEDALCFGIDHPNEQREHPLAFLHEPVRDGVLVLDSVLVLDGSLGGVGRYLFLIRFERGWSRNVLLAGVRPSASA